MHVARRLLVLVPVLLGLGCTKDNFFYVTESDSSPASGSDSDTNEDDCVEETTTIKIEDAFFVKNHGGGACPIRDTGKPCASLNWGKTGGLRLDNNGEITSAYVIRPKAPLENLVSGPEKIMNAKLQVMFYRDNDGKVADSQDFILARIAEGNLWDEGDEDGFLPEGEGSTYDYLSPLKMNEWIGQNGPIGTAESNTRICGIFSVSMGSKDSYEMKTLCPDKMTDLVKMWVVQKDRTGLVLYLAEAEANQPGRGYWVKSMDQANDDYKPVLSISYCKE